MFFNYEKINGNFQNFFSSEETFLFFLLKDRSNNIPIQEMGNYHDYLKSHTPPLRDIESKMVRQHMFGNPFKLVSREQKKSMFGADEIDEILEESTENQHQQKVHQQQAMKIHF